MCQGTNGLIYVVSSNDRSKVVDATNDFNNIFDYEVRGAFLLAFANTSTPMATCSGKKLTAVHKDTDLCWGDAIGGGDDSVITSSKVQSPTSGAGPGQADMGCGSSRVIGKMAGGGCVPPPAQWRL